MPDKRSSISTPIRFCLVFAVVLTMPLVVYCQNTEEAPGQSPEQTIDGVVFVANGGIITAGSTIEVKLADVSLADALSQTVAVYSHTLELDETTVSFSLSYPLSVIDVSRRYAVQARVTSPGGKLLFVSTAVHPVDPQVSVYGFAVIVDSVSTAGQQEYGLPPVPIGKSFEYYCAGVTFIVRVGPGEVALWIPSESGGGYRVLSRAPSETGRLFVDGEVSFWSRGEEAEIRIGDYSYPNCRVVLSQ